MTARNGSLWDDYRQIAGHAIRASLPDQVVEKALRGRAFSGRKLIVAAGKAAWQMARTAYDAMDGKIDGGIVITKYGHSMGPIGPLECYEAGHPVPDENSFRATARAIELVKNLRAEDSVIFLLSGGGSALFESPLISGEELQEITNELLASGADIVEINTIRKRLSAVKGGRFARLCAPARVFAVILSDVLGKRPDMIASGPVCAAPSSSAQAQAIAEKYHLRLSPAARCLLAQETPKTVENAECHITGGVGALCAAAAAECYALGYRPLILTDSLCCQAREAGSFLAAVARTHAEEGENLAFLAGGETVVHLTGKGKGGRNQELALAAAEGIRGLDNVLIFSLGSDGTDGPTDAAGGVVDGGTAAALERQGRSIHAALANNDAYPALRSVGGLIMTGPTGTNVNDVAVVLIRGRKGENA